MSPEQCSRGVSVDHRSDIYSTAVSLYEALSGKLRYSGAGNSFRAFGCISVNTVASAPKDGQSGLCCLRGA